MNEPPGISPGALMWFLVFLVLSITVLALIFGLMGNG
jgi:hypothetical protein